MMKNEKLSSPADPRALPAVLTEAPASVLPIPFSRPDDHEKVLARRQHAWRTSGRRGLDAEGGEHDVPSDTDHKALCPHGNVFNVCYGCMSAAGLSGREIQKRRARATNLEHGGAQVLSETPAEPERRLSVEELSRANAERLGAAVRKATGA